MQATSVYAGIAQLVERNLAKVEVAGSNPVSRSNILLLRLIAPLDFLLITVNFTFASGYTIITSIPFFH
jgi:hypothetical protein